MNVLLIVENSAERQRLTSLLSRESVVNARSVREASEYFQQLELKLVVCDVVFCGTLASDFLTIAAKCNQAPQFLCLIGASRFSPDESKSLRQLQSSPNVDFMKKSTIDNGLPLYAQGISERKKADATTIPSHATSASNSGTAKIEDGVDRLCQQQEQLSNEVAKVWQVCVEVKEYMTVIDSRLSAIEESSAKQNS